ncbi:hypothetical protein Bbelb_174380 [Branchiostoma belcheri]|nr:hypothetical protein Bbelb_174380 [Branchiostoma belcheri]
MAVECHTSAQFKLTACPLETLVPQLADLIPTSRLSAPVQPLLTDGGLSRRHTAGKCASAISKFALRTLTVRGPSRLAGIPLITDNLRLLKTSTLALHKQPSRVFGCGLSNAIQGATQADRTFRTWFATEGNVTNGGRRAHRARSTFSRKSVVRDVTDLGDVTDIVQETVVAEGGAAFLGRPFNRVREESSALDRRATCMVTDIRCRGGLHEKPVLHKTTPDRYNLPMYAGLSPLGSRHVNVPARADEAREGM